MGIEIPIELYALLLIEAAESCSTVEEIVERAFKHFMERIDSNGE